MVCASFLQTVYGSEDNNNRDSLRGAVFEIRLFNCIVYE